MVLPYICREQTKRVVCDFFSLDWLILLLYAIARVFVCECVSASFFHFIVFYYTFVVNKRDYRPRMGIQS